MIPKIQWRGLRIKIIAWSFIPTMIIMIAVAVFIFFAYNNVTQDLAIEENRDTASFEAGRLTVELQDYEDLLDGEARILGALSESQPLEQDALVSSKNRFAVFDGGVILLDNYGKVIAAEPARPDILGADWSNHSYYDQIATSEAAQTTVFSDIVSDGINSGDCIAVAVPVTDTQGRFVGLLAGLFNIGTSSVSAFYGDIVKLNWSDEGNACVIDSTGRIIYHTDTSRIGEDVANREAVSLVLSGKTDAIRTEDLDGNAVLASFAPVSGTPWGLVIAKDWKEVIGTNQNYRNILVALLGLGVLLPTLIVYFGVRRITRPISDVSSAAREIAAGNFSHRIFSKTGDELEEMANQFNSMAEALEESYATLEQKVEDRTRGERRRTEQLRTLNEVGRSISSILQLDELFPYVVNTLKDTFNYYNVGIIIVDRESGELRLKASAGAYEAGPDSTSGPARKDLVNKVFLEGEPLLVNDIKNDPAYCCAEGLGDTRSELAVPIRLGVQILGVLDIEATQVGAFDELDLFTAQTLADQLAIAIENARLYQETRDVAIHEERNRLARDLHDAVSQTLFSASLIAEVLPRLWESNPEEAKRRLEEVRQLTRGALAEMRTLLLELRPSALTEADLPHLISQLAESIGGRTRAQVNFSVEGDCSSLQDEVKIALYRIAQEALNNVAKHAGASEVKIVLLCQHEKVTLQIMDNGQGFDMAGVPADSFGLGIMRERAAGIGASLSVKSLANNGTEIMVVWNDLPGEDRQ